MAIVIYVSPRGFWVEVCDVVCIDAWLVSVVNVVPHIYEGWEASCEVLLVGVHKIEAHPLSVVFNIGSDSIIIKVSFLHNDSCGVSKSFTVAARVAEDPVEDTVVVYIWDCLLIFEEPILKDIIDACLGQNVFWFVSITAVCLIVWVFKWGGLKTGDVVSSELFWSHFLSVTSEVGEADLPVLKHSRLDLL